MPVLSPVIASAVEATTRSDTFTAAATTAALASGTTYLVIVTSSATCDQNNSQTEQEVTAGGTRYAFARDQVGASGSPSAANGSHISTAFTYTGNGSDVVAVNFRRASGTTTRDHFCTCHILAIPLSSLTLGTHYWAAEATNSDTLTNPSAGAGWVGSGEQVDVTPSATGNFLIIACGEGEFTAGHTATDQIRMRCRVTEDPTGTPSSYNLQRNTVSAIEGPEVCLDGQDTWGELAVGQRFLDVLELTSGTTYRFEIEREGVAGTANTGYRRERVFVFDLSVWPEFAFSRDIDGQSGQDLTFATASASAPSGSTDYLLLGATVYQNNNTWLRTWIDQDPSGTPTQLPSSASGFGVGLPDAGNAATDDYGLIGVQWDRQGITTAEDYALRFEAPIQPCRVGAERGVNPGGADDGVATLMVAWGMETTTSGGVSAIDGQSDGSATSTGALDGTGDLSGSSAGAASVSGALFNSSTLSGSSTGTSSAAADLGGLGALAATAAGTSAAALSTGGGVAATDAVIAFIGNSYTQNYGSLPTLLQYYLDQRLPGNTTSLGPPPHLGTSIANSTDGYYPGMTLGGMALYPTIDQRSNSGTTDATDAVDSVANDFYDFVVLTSGFRQETEVPGTIDYEVLSGAGGTNPNVYGVFLEVKRRVRTELITDDGSTAQVIVRMTHEGFNANDDTSLADVERTVRLQVLGARQLEFEGVADVVVPDHYVWSRLQWGTFGAVGSTPTGPVSAYASLTHTNSNQPGGANEAWLNRSQGDSAPFNTNGHQNALATIVQVWIWGYALWGIDPRGDTTFAGSPAGLPSPFDEMISPTGSNIYGGHNTGLGNQPYDTGVNPGGPPDSELDLDWSTATQEEIQDIIVAAVDDYNAGTTEFEPPVGLEGTVAGSSTATADLTAIVAIDGSASGSSTVSASLDGVATATGQSDGSSSTSGALVGTGAAAGQSDGASTSTASISDASAYTGSATGSSTATATLTGQGQLSASVVGQATATLAANPFDRDAFVEVVAVLRTNEVIPIQIG